MFSRDGILLWIPLFDTNQDTGGLTIYENHLNGFLSMLYQTKNLKSKVWTKNFTHISDSIVKS